MTSLLKIGLILMAVTVLLVLVHPADADDDVKRKRVIIKIPHRVKHIYHHHTKKVHVHKKKPKPKPKKKKPHKHVHVVVEEEEIVQPIKSWKTVHSPFKGSSSGWDDWKASPSGFKPSVKHPEETHLEEEFMFEDDHETKETRTSGRPHSHKGIRGGGSKRGRPKSGRPSSFRNHDDTSYEGSFETYHHYDHDQDFGGERPRSKPKSKMSIGNSGQRPNGRGSSKSRPNYRPTRRPQYEEKYLEPDEYDELYDRGPAYPERKEHPSWHGRPRDQREQEGPVGVGSEPNVWNLPQVPEVKEYIDDVNDVPDPGVTYGNSGGFYPSSFQPITTITSSVVEMKPHAVPQGGGVFPGQIPNVPPNVALNTNFRPPDAFDPVDQPRAPPRSKTKKKPKNAGYVNNVSLKEGLTVGYQSHVGHSSDVRSPSSSYQSVSYGDAHT